MKTSLGLGGYAYDSHLSYLDHLRLADSAREASDHGSRRTESAIAAAASEVAGAVHEVTSEIRAANDIMEWGFSALINEMAEMRTTLKALLQCAREPSQTWAYEQFEIARDNFRKANYDDCLKRLGYAIDGYQTHLGYPEEWRLHQLRGDIYLQCRNRSLIDLPRAEKCFLAAAKYADTSNAKAMALTAAAVAAYNQGHMVDAEKHAQQACEVRRKLADAHFQLARIRLNRLNYDGAWQAALEAITLDHRYAARLPLDSEFQRNAKVIIPAWGQYTKELKARLEAVVQSAAEKMRELDKSRDEANRWRCSRAFELLDLAGEGLAEAKARFQKMILLVNELSPEAELSLKVLADNLRGSSVFAILEAEPQAQRANDLLTRALAASHEATLTIQKVKELSQGLPRKPKVFLPEPVCVVLSGVCFFAIIALGFNAVVCITAIVGYAVGSHAHFLPKNIGELGDAVLYLLSSLALALGVYYSSRLINSKALYHQLIEKFDWKAANAPQTAAAADGTIFRATEPLKQTADDDDLDAMPVDSGVGVFAGGGGGRGGQGGGGTTGKSDKEIAEATHSRFGRWPSWWDPATSQRKK